MLSMQRSATMPLLKRASLHTPTTRNLLLIHGVGTIRTTSIRLHASSSSATTSTASSLRAKLTRQWNAVFHRRDVSSRWKFAARVMKYIRIPFLIVSVYGLGYQQGVVDYARDPMAKKQALMDSILAGVGCYSRDHVDIVNYSAYTSTSTSSRIARVGPKIVRVAQGHVQEQLQQAIDNIMLKLPPDATRDQVQLACSQDEDVVFWNQACARLFGQQQQGNDSSNTTWSYVLVDTHVANAFVTEILPRHIFVTTAMMDSFVENDDELALILGHEVSHLILGHVSEANMIATFLRVLEILLLTMDPTEGLLSMAVVASLATARNAVAAAYSRENEHLADELGIQLAAMACYDTQRAARVFYKMHQHLHDCNDKSKSPFGLLDTHPPSLERHEMLIKASDVENKDKYLDSTCASVQSRLKGLLAASKKDNSR